MVVKFNSIPVLHLPGRDLRLTIDPEVKARDSITAIITEIAPGCELPVHKHDVGEETMYFAAGTADTVCDGEIIRVGVGDTFNVPAGSTHTVRNVGTETVRMFCVFNPPIDTSHFKTLAGK